ncbi:phosphodiesterase [Streptomyces sp. ACA25]|uniref:phosphodiesterase n=1 Tax=Streptomyces sp. ACA25 TaxID=3022596 RepID=UPI0023076211|nr:phosphodiesterase [Streptomyces sp. ACA25]MDB1090029.1 phosphodiesterase [Streptomyces sp. ACA25]
MNGGPALPERWVRGVFRHIARRRAAPAAHPRGLTCPGVLEVPGGDPPWNVPLLDRPGRHEVLVRWSRAAGLPGSLPDALGLAVRVPDAGGPGRPLDLLLTSSGAGRLTRHLPLPRRDALAGPYSSVQSHQVGDRVCVVLAFPHDAGRRIPGTLPGIRAALDRAPARFALRCAAAGDPWRTLALLTVGPPLDRPPVSTLDFEPFAHSLPGLHPTLWLRRLRDAAYAGSREGRHSVIRPAAHQ